MIGGRAGAPMTPFIIGPGRYFTGETAAADAIVRKLQAGEKGKSWDLGTGDRNFRLVMAIVSLAMD